MNRRTLTFGGAATALAATLARPARAVPPTTVLELFTSQGCSSCPPADTLLGELGRRPDVIALAWHVDYWNSLGWRDPFASRAWTERQRSYARALRDEVYTPALVLNGASMVIGSDRQAVNQALRQAQPLPVGVSLRRVAGGLEVEVGALSAPTSMLVVTYDPEHATRVGAGENGGRQLREYRIVRDVVSRDAASGRIGLPDVSSSQGVAVLLQDNNWKITGAAELRPL